MMAEPQANNNSQSSNALPFLQKWTWLALMLLFGLYIRAHGTSAYTFSNDEFMHLNIASGETLGDVLRYSLFETHPPLFYILLHFWRMISDTAAFLRCLPLTLGMALIIIYYCIGKKMGGQLAGLCSATLIALSNGCIIQSALLRQYCVLMPCMAMAFYCYLSWRENHKSRQLTGYVFFGWLSALSHFSAVFCFASIAAFECIDLLRAKAPKTIFLPWILANLLVIELALFLYHMWQPALISGWSGEISYNWYFSYWLSHAGMVQESKYHFLTSALLAPFAAASYIYPPFPLMPALAIYTSLRPPQTPQLRHIQLTIAAFLLSALLYISGLYTSLTGRHNLWLLPFIVPVAGATAARWITRPTTNPRRRCLVNILFAIFFIGLSAAYDFGYRFIEGSDYEGWNSGPWQTLLDTLNTLGPRDMIITDKDGINMLINIYRYRDDDEFMNRGAIALAPYKNTFVMVNPQFFYHLDTRIILSTLQRAFKAHQLDNIDRIIFLKLWNKDPFYKPLVCGDLEKTLIYSSAPSGSMTPEGFRLADLAVAAISKQTIMNDVIPANGSAHDCFIPPAESTKQFFPP